MRASDNWLVVVRPTGGVIITGDDNYEHQVFYKKHLKLIFLLNKFL